MVALRQEKNGMKRGQISMEVMYAIGVLMIIFIILSAVAFNRRMELKKNEEYFYKRSECLRLSNTLSTVYNLGPQTTMNISVVNNVTVLSDTTVYPPLGLIVVASAGKTNAVQASCTFTANTTKSLYLLNPSTTYIVENKGGSVHIR